MIGNLRDTSPPLGPVIKLKVREPRGPAGQSHSSFLGQSLLSAAFLAQPTLVPSLTTYSRQADFLLGWSLSPAPVCSSEVETKHQDPEPPCLAGAGLGLL